MTANQHADVALRRFILLTCLAGVISSLAVIVLSRVLDLGSEATVESTGWVVALAIGVTTVAQWFYVRVRHGGTWEELNFYEVVLGIGVLLLAPPVVLLAGLCGVLLGEILIRREPIKVVYNLAMYATATSAMIMVYEALMALRDLAGGSDRLNPTSAYSLLCLFLSAGVFTAVNLGLLAGLLHVTGGARVGDVLRQERRLSILMTLGSVCIAFTAVALAEVTPVAVPLAFMPALALWYAYGASAQHAQAAERNRWLVTLGGSLARHGQGTSLHESVNAIREIVEAPESQIVEPGPDAGRWSTAVLATVRDTPGPLPLPTALLPAGWRTGVVTRLDLGTDNPGALLLGSTMPYRQSRIVERSRGWALAEADAPVLVALVAAVGSATRAGVAFEALTEETAKLTAVVDNTSDGIAVVDDAGSVRLWSQTMATMTGVPATDLATHTDADLGTASPAVRALLTAARNTDGSGSAEVHLVRADGEELDVSLSTVRVREATAATSSESAGWVSILTVHDETRERRVERMKSDFVATVSHELRTPITPIKGYAHLLATRGDRMTPERQAAALRVISERAEHLDRLVDDLLFASRVTSPTQLKIVMGVEDLGDIVRQAIETFPAMAPLIHLELPEEPVRVQCDRIRAVQCLSNLLRNAEKYAPGAPVSVRAEVAGHNAYVHVRDHGRGIPASEQEKVFDRFYRIEDPLTMRTGGAGLGLHIARELATTMGGSLELRTPQGPGAEFVLGLATDQAPPVQMPKPAHGQASPNPLPPAAVPGRLPPRSMPAPNLPTPNLAAPNLSAPNLSAPNLSAPNAVGTHLATPLGGPNLAAPQGTEPVPIRDSSEGAEPREALRDGTMATERRAAM